jgi:hypothetical protein
LLLEIGLGEEHIVSIFCGRADGNFWIADSVFLMDFPPLPSQLKENSMDNSMENSISETHYYLII